jgi:hypothetical protein
MTRFSAGTWAVFGFGLDGDEVVARSNSASLADGEPNKPVRAKAEGEALKGRRLVRAKHHGRPFHAISFRLKVGRRRGQLQADQGFQELLAPGSDVVDELELDAPIPSA